MSQTHTCSHKHTCILSRVMNNGSTNNRAKLLMLSFPCAYKHVAVCVMPLLHLVTLYRLAILLSCPPPPNLFSSIVSPCRRSQSLGSGLSTCFPIGLTGCKPLIGLNVAATRQQLHLNPLRCVSSRIAVSTIKTKQKTNLSLDLYQHSVYQSSSVS